MVRFLSEVGQGRKDEKKQFMPDRGEGQVRGKRKGSVCPRGGPGKGKEGNALTFSATEKKRKGGVGVRKKKKNPLGERGEVQETREWRYHPSLTPPFSP